MSLTTYREETKQRWKSKHVKLYPCAFHSIKCIYSLPRLSWRQYFSLLLQLEISVQKQQLFSYGGFDAYFRETETDIIQHKLQQCISLDADLRVTSLQNIVTNLCFLMKITRSGNLLTPKVILSALSPHNIYWFVPIVQKHTCLPLGMSVRVNSVQVYKRGTKVRKMKDDWTESPMPNSYTTIRNLNWC